MGQELITGPLALPILAVSVSCVTRVGTLDVAPRQSSCGDGQEMCLLLAGQLIIFLQVPCNSPAWCPPRVTHLPGKGL